MRTPRPAAAAGRRTGLFGYFVDHRTAANLLMAAMLVAGLYSGTQIRSQFFPDVPIEVVRVDIRWSGVGPEEMDRTVVARLEPRLRGVAGLASLRAAAREGRATIRLEFVAGWDMEAAVDEVKAAVDETADLPEDIETPEIRRARFHDLVTDVIVSGPVTRALLYDYGEELRTALFRAGVVKTRLIGVSAPEIRIDVPPDALERHGLSLRAIADAVAAETGTQPVGDFARGAARVRTDAGRETVRRIAAIAVRSLPDGSKLRLGDFATVHEEGLDRNQALLRDGRPAIRVRVERDATGDAIALQRAVEDVVNRMAPSLPRSVEMTLTRTHAQAIVSRLDLLLDNGALGLAIVLVLLFLFLSARTAFWVAAGIPVAMAATVALMYAAGFTLNMVSLFALILCLGIVVDDAIVVGEHADHLAGQGMPPADAAAQAARRMAGPVFCASITTVIAFAVITLIGGRFGRMLADLPFTVCVVVIASLVECFVVLPAHMRHALRAGARRRWFDAPSQIVNRVFVRFREGAFRRFVHSVIRLRYPVWGAALLLLAVSASAVIDRTVRWRFFVAPERGTVTANFAMLPGAVRADTRAMLDELSRALAVVDARYAETHGRAPVEMSIAKLGGTTGRGLTGADTMDPDRLGGFDIVLIDPDERPYTAFAFLADWRAEIRRPPKLERLALRQERRGPAREDILLRLSGADSRTLKAAALDLQAQLARFPAVSGLEDDLAYDKPELVVRLTPRGEALGLSTATLARTLRERLDGIEATSFARGAHEVGVRVRLPEDATGPGYLHRARLPVAGGAFVPLSSIATIAQTSGFSVIRREAGTQVVTVTGDLDDDAAARAEIADALTGEILPEITGRYGVAVTQGGLAEQERDFLSDARLGLALCLTGIYLALAWVFGSWTRPLAVMLVIPFGLIGAVWGHHLHGIPLSMFSVVGLLGMIGIIINDSIVLVSQIDRHRKTRGTLAAVVAGTCDRLRAVLLTTVTTIGGLAPLLFETSRQAAFLKPTVLTLVYGLGFGVVIVVMITPATVAIQHDIGLRLKSARRMVRWAARQWTG